MSALDRKDEFTDEVFTRDRRAWWAEMPGIPGVNTCTDERLTVREAFKKYLPWDVRKVQLYDPETFAPSSVYVHKRSDRPDSAEPVGMSTERCILVQNADHGELLHQALDGSDYAVASIGALKHGALTFCSVDFTEAPDIEAGGQRILPFVALLNSFDAHGALRAYATGIRPECMNTIDIGWLTGVQLGKLSHTTKIMEKVPQLQDEIRRYLDLIPMAERTIARLIDTDVNDATLTRALDNVVRIPNPTYKDGKVKNAAAITRAEAKREAIRALALDDPRVGFDGTAWGLFQAFSTWDQQERSFRRTARSGITSRAHSALTAHFSGKQRSQDTIVMKGLLRSLEGSQPVKVTKAGLQLV